MFDMKDIRIESCFPSVCTEGIKSGYIKAIHIPTGLSYIEYFDFNHQSKFKLKKNVLQKLEELVKEFIRNDDIRKNKHMDIKIIL
jgi:hypothetical protein